MARPPWETGDHPGCRPVRPCIPPDGLALHQRRESHRSVDAHARRAGDHKARLPPEPHRGAWSRARRRPSASSWATWQAPSSRTSRGAEDALAPAGYSLILSSSRRDPERELRNVRHLLERATDGLILGAPQCPPGDLAELAQRAGVLMVFLNRRRWARNVFSAVWVDWPSATTEVATYLAELGHRRIALVVPVRSDASGWKPEDWYRPALAKAGLGPERSLVLREACRSRAGTAPASVCLPSPPGRPQPSVTTT